jgi:Fe-Mn family superoxide dismutase
MKFTLPELPYSPEALEPVIDAKTMRTHHGKHHKAYIDNLNEALAKYPELEYNTIDDLLFDLDSLPEDIQDTVRNNGGGHYNHSMFWKILTPVGSFAPPSKELMGKIEEDFGSFEEFKKQFAEAAKTRFGSGWAWLIVTRDGTLKVTSTPNQDTPLDEGVPILGLDVWEHAYYLNYLNRRPDYIVSFFSVINWKAVESLLGE